MYDMTGVTFLVQFAVPNVHASPPPPNKLTDDTVTASVAVEANGSTSFTAIL